MKAWHLRDRLWRIQIDLIVGDHDHFERAVSLELTESVASPRVVEVDAEGQLLDAAVCLQPCDEELLFHLKGETGAGQTRHFQMYFDAPDAEMVDPEPVPGPLSLTRGLDHEGFASIRIDSPRVSWIYHLEGGGFAGMIDSVGANWISYHPRGGSDGNYRGIPNLVHPESYFHPGRTGCSSEVVASGPLRVVIFSRSNDDAWRCEWRLEPDCARLTVLKAARPYWLLYEGTPGGRLDEQGDFLLLADGRRFAASERWEMERLPEPGWIAFGASGSPRALWLMRHEADGDADSYWPMEGNMTVFGFGRSGLTKSLLRVPAHFSVGLADCNDHVSLSNIIHASSNPPQLRMGRKESRG
ncbi:MAG: hypothetical protein OXF44_10245 [Anaerolineaceae bacterium]|nr:hypothetical protein [Anaerolineaceae bacterium]